ncbi:cell division protein ZapD [Chitinivorax sp. PXF-14]|uniref:cell division protein ZapD n=1 Tax=Chitinivorax sp. PXF-14 TaxID=3230488 RepID=UPI003466CD63
MISYEFPLNERIRTMLRLEDLFARFSHFSDKAEAHDHHAALMVLFEIMEVASRADLKSDLIQELERQKHSLEALRNNPQIAEDALDAVLGEIEDVSAKLLEMVGRIGQHLRENDWLMSIKQRTSIPGGACEFDLPSYFYWQRQPVQTRHQALLGWMAPMLPLKDGFDIVLRLLRDSGKTMNYTARQGMFQQMSGGKVVQLIKVSLDEQYACVPELSANKYAINIRFIHPVLTLDKPRQFDGDVNFQLTYCNL